MVRFSIFVCLFLCLYRFHAQELSIEHSVKVEFPTQAGYDYTVYTTTDPNQQSGWKPLGLISHATGEKATFFYQTSPDQKVFFKVEGEPSTGAPPAAQTSSILPITSLPPGTIPGLYDLGDALGESPSGGAYRMIVPPGTFDYVILLPHPSEAGYHGLQLKLSLFQGGTGLGSGRVILRVPTTDGSSYEPLKMIDNGSQSIVEEVAIMDASGSTQPRKVVIDLFNDSRSSDATGGQWVINTPSEGGGSAIGHLWEGTQLALQKEDGTWGDFVDLRGAQGERGLKGDKGDQGDPGLKGDKGDKGDRGQSGTISSAGYDLSLFDDYMREEWSNKNFDGLDLSGINFDSSLRYTKQDSTLGFGDLEYIVDSSFQNANLTNVSFDDFRIERCDFSGATLVIYDPYMHFVDCNLRNAKISILEDGGGSAVWFTNCVMPNGQKYTGQGLP